MSVLVQIETEIAAPPVKVWRALVNFAHYPDWNPHREIEGAAGLGQRLIVRVGPDPQARRPLAATITVFEPAKALTLQTGRWWTGRAHENFRLQSSRRGTLLRHSAEMPDFAVWLTGREKYQAYLAQVYRRVDDALAAHLSPHCKGRPTVRAARRGRR